MGDLVTSALSVLTVMAAMLGVLVSALGSLLSRRARIRLEQEDGAETPQQRFDRLTKSLREAASVAGEIEEEVQRRRQIADQLQEDIERYERLKEINQEEIEAVTQVIGGELRKEGRRSFWAGFVMNFVFFLLGVGATIGLSLVFGL